ncbi:MAG: hypothetical protein ABIR91_00675 [Candidatus Saccharimonadales bacterium]
MSSEKYRRFGAVWGVAGVGLLLLFAIVRLLPFVWELEISALDIWQWIAISGWSVFMLYSEGYMAFQKQFAPRVIARAQYIYRYGTPKQILLAPLFCVGYFNASVRRIAVAYGLLLGIIGLIAIVHFIPQPWRGVIDVGVILGLVYGIICLMFFAYKALQPPHLFVADPEVIVS